jgi:tripartite-type tricarboxylate transporter receptor subunit TctC
MRPPSPPKIGPGRIGRNEKRGRFGNTWQNPMLTRRSIVLAPMLAGAVMPFNRAAQADDFPSGPITIVVSFPAGGSTDVVVRAVAAKLQERLGKPVVVENRAGAGGVIATTDVVRAAPDGLPLLAAPSSLAANPTLFKSLPFDTLKDLQPLSLVFRTPLVLVVNPALPVHSVADLIALLKQKPGQIDFAHGGPGSAIHLAGELLQTMTRTRMTAVAYRGAPLGLTDVMAGHVALMFADAGTVVAQINAGSVRALGVSSTVRVPALPDVPTIAEAGVPGFDAVGWTMICAPAATPKPIVDKLAVALDAAAETSDVQALIVKLGTIPVKSPLPAELDKFLAAEIDRWGDIIKRAGVANTL